LEGAESTRSFLTRLRRARQSSQPTRLGTGGGGNERGRRKGFFIRVIGDCQEGLVTAARACDLAGSSPTNRITKISYQVYRFPSKFAQQADYAGLARRDLLAERRHYGLLRDRSTLDVFMIGNTNAVTSHHGDTQIQMVRQGLAHICILHADNASSSRAWLAGTSARGVRPPKSLI
jgi:hypothetical protein